MMELNSFNFSSSFKLFLIIEIILFCLFIFLEDEDGNKMDGQQIFDEIATLFIAGQETTTNAILFALRISGNYVPAPPASFSFSLCLSLPSHSPTLSPSIYPSCSLYLRQIHPIVFQIRQKHCGRDK